LYVVENVIESGFLYYW